MSASASAPSAEARTAELFAPGLRGLTLGLVSTITLVALESLAIGTVMPIVAEELGDLELYGWVYSAFFLGNLVGIVVAGGALDRVPLHRPFAVGLVLFAAGPPDRRARAVDAGPRRRRGSCRASAAARSRPTAYVAIGRVLPERLQPRMFAMLSTAWVVPGIIGPSRSRRSSARSRAGAGCSWACCRCCWSRAGSRSQRAAPRPEGAAPRADRSDRRHGHACAGCVAALARGGRAPASCRGAGLAAAGRADRRRGVVGAALLLPAFRWLTPRGTLLLALGVPAAVLLRGVMTFAFFSGDAYIPLLLQTWRGTPATLTGLVFTVTTLRLDRGLVAPGAADRPVRPAAVRGARLRAASPLGALITIPAVLPRVPPEITILTWVLPGLGMGFMYSAVTLVVLRGVGRPGAGERLVVAPAVGHPGHGAGHRHRRRDHRGGRAGGCATPSAWRSRRCSRCRSWPPLGACSGAAGWATSGPVAGTRGAEAAAVD